MILRIIFIILGWLVAGAVINLIAYGGKPKNEWGSSDYASGWHWVINIITILLLLGTIFN
jgi:sterol desaturase/sphingolipid hydroxylase (fatty acid hydroxylase superfamily)